MIPDRITHPGPRASERVTALPCRVERRTLELPAGQPLDEAVSEAVAAAGAEAAYLKLRDAPADTLDFVRPAPAPGDGHAAWYSATTTLSPATIVEAGLHLGRRDGAPFLHVHGLWREPSGAEHVGHLLSPATRLTRPVPVEAFLIHGAILETAQDVETDFPLFRPHRNGSAERANAVVATIRPNEIIHAACERIAREAGMGPARIEGIGSAVGTRFADGTGLQSYATEMLVREGRVARGTAELDCVSVGFDGRHAAGKLSPQNRVCVTFELLLVEE